MRSLCTITEGSGYIDGYAMDGDSIWCMVVVGATIYARHPSDVTVTGLNITNVNIVGQNLTATPTGDELQVSII